MASKYALGLVAIGVITLLGCGDGGTGATTAGAGGTTTKSGTGGAGGLGGGGGTGGVTTTSSTTASGTGGGPTLDPSGFSCSGATPSLANDVVPITTQSCSMGVGCHVAAKTANGVMDQFVNRIAEECTDLRLMIDPGKPERSYVIHKMTNHNICTGQTMPKDQQMMGQAEIQVVYDWICNGAQNN